MGKIVKVKTKNRAVRIARAQNYKKVTVVKRATKKKTGTYRLSKRVKKKW